MAELRYFIDLDLTTDTTALSGEISTKAFPGLFELSDYAFVASTDVGLTSGSFPTSQKVDFQDLTATIRFGSNSLGLFDGMYLGRALDEIRIIGVNDADTIVETLSFTGGALGAVNLTGTEAGYVTASLSIGTVRAGITAATVEPDGKVGDLWAHGFDVSTQQVYQPPHGVSNGAEASGTSAPENVDFYIRIDGIDGSVEGGDYAGWFKLSDFDIDQSRLLDMASGKHGKTLADFDLTLHSTTGLTHLLQSAATGQAIGKVQIDGVLANGDMKGTATRFLEVKLGNVLLDNVATGADQSIDLGVGGVGAMTVKTYSYATDGSGKETTQQFGWSFETNDKTDTAFEGDPTSTPERAAMPADTFYIAFDDIVGNATSKGVSGYTRLSSFDFSLATEGKSPDLGALSFAGDFSAIASQLHLKSLTSEVGIGARVIGMRQDQVVYDLAIDEFLVSRFQATEDSTGNGDLDQLTLDARKVQLVTHLFDQKTGVVSGSTDFSFDFATNEADVAVTQITPGTDPVDDTPITAYYLKFDGLNGAAVAGDSYANWIRVDSLSLDSQTFTTFASLGGGGGSGKSILGPLTLTGDFGSALTWMIGQQQTGGLTGAVVHGVAFDGKAQFAVQEEYRLGDVSLDLGQILVQSDQSPGLMSVDLTAKQTGIKNTVRDLLGKTTTVDLGVWNADLGAVTDGTVATSDSGTQVVGGAMTLDYYLQIEGLGVGDVLTKGYTGTYRVDSLDLSALVDEGYIDLDLDFGLALTEAQLAAATNKVLSNATLVGVTAGADTKTSYELFRLSLEDLQIDALATNADGTESVGLTTTRYGLTQRTVDAKGALSSSPLSFGYDLEINAEATVSSSVVARTAQHVGTPTGYYIKIEGIDGTSTDPGRAGWFKLDGWDGGDLSAFGPVGDKGATTAKLSDVVLEFDDAALTVGLYEAMTTGDLMKYVVIEGVGVIGDGQETVTSIVLNDVMVNQVNSVMGRDTASLAFAQFGRLDQGVSKTGHLDAQKSFAWDLTRNVHMDFADLAIANRPPVVQMKSVLLDRDTMWAHLPDYLTVSDPDGDAITRYELRDTTGAHNWYADGRIVGATAGYVTTNLNGVWIQRDATETTQQLAIRASDGSEWSDWTTFDLTTQNLNTRPEVRVNDQFMFASSNAWRKLESVLVQTDAEGDTLGKFQIWDDTGTASWWADGKVVDASAGYTVTNLGNVWFRPDTVDSVQTLWVRGHDGYDWSGWDSFQLHSRVANEKPVVSLPNQTMVIGSTPWTRLPDVMSIKDGNGDPIRSITLWDSTGGHNWYADGRVVDASRGYTTTNVDGVWFQRDATPSTQTLWVNASDGFEFSGWKAFTLTTRATNAAPEVEIADQVMSTDDYNWVRLNTVANYSDADGDRISKIQLWDSNGAGNWWADGKKLTNPNGYVTENLDGVWFSRDTSPSVQTLWVKAHDGFVWGDWEPFVVTTQAPSDSDFLV